MVQMFGIHSNIVVSVSFRIFFEYLILYIFLLLYLIKYIVLMFAIKSSLLRSENRLLN